MNRLFTICALAVLIVQSHSHAILKAPTPWTATPSKSSPCGNGVINGNVAATFTAGENVTLSWSVIAGDGTGAVSVMFDTAGGTTFSNAATVFGPNPTAVTTYAIKFRVPSTLTCNSCSMQVKSTTAWFSCATVKIVAPAVNPNPNGNPSNNDPSGTYVAPTTSPTALGCAQSGNLTFCSVASFKNVVGKVALFSQQDAGVEKTYNEITSTGSSVFLSKTDACLSTYKMYLCAQAFPLCGSSGACASLCKNVWSNCNVNASHANLFDCASKQTTLDTAGFCAATSTAVSIESVHFSIFAALMLLTVFF